VVIKQTSDAEYRNGRGPSGVSDDELPREYELRIDGSWQPAVLEFERHEDGDGITDPAWPSDGRSDARLNVNEFNIRQIEAACGRNALELRDNHGGFWTFLPRQIRYESDAFADGELRSADPRRHPR
jgi:hypothetical protein